MQHHRPMTRCGHDPPRPALGVHTPDKQAEHRAVVGSVRTMPYSYSGRLCRLNACHYDPLGHRRNCPISGSTHTHDRTCLTSSGRPPKDTRPCSFDYWFYYPAIKSNAMALAIVLQHTGCEICEECVSLRAYLCPDEWFHEATACCPVSESMWDIREEHHEECAMRALCRLALTCSDLARRAPVKTTLSPGV